MKNKIDYTLYLCTDRTLMTSSTIEESVEKAVRGGVTVVQLREKNISSREFLSLALKVKRITDFYNVPLIINDRLDIAIASDASGVHVGQSDLPADIVRKILGRDKILGVSASTLKQAVKARDDGADYIGVGAMYSTNTKTDAETVTMDELIKIRGNVSIPIVVIGGINKNTVSEFKNRGIDGIAVVSAIVSENDVENAARSLKKMFIG